MILVLSLLTFTDMFGYAIVVPVLPFAAQHFGAGTLTVGAIFASYSLCQLISAPVLGAMSDWYGRRLLLLISQSGSVIGFAIMALAGSVWPLFLSRIVDGLTAGNISIIWAAVLEHYSRPAWGRRFANLTTATGLGILLGLVTSSVLARYGLAVVAWVAVALILLNMVITLRAFPERSSTRTPTPGSRRLADLLRHPRNAVARQVVGAGLLSTIGQSAFLLALPFFLAQLLHFNAQESAITITVLFAFAAAFQVLLLGPAVTWLGDRRTALAGFALMILGGSGLAAARTLALVLVAGTVVMWGIVLLSPSMTALLGATNRALDEGAIMGINQSIASAGQMLGPLVGYAAIALFSTRGYGIVCALIAMAGLALTARIRLGDARL